MKIPFNAWETDDLYRANWPRRNAFCIGRCNSIGTPILFEMSMITLPLSLNNYVSQHCFSLGSLFYSSMHRFNKLIFIQLSVYFHKDNGV